MCWLKTAISHAHGRDILYINSIRKIGNKQVLTFEF